jgi:EAL domain-containing protein (putative c-di-GMP-specific phosphodiesterase class I)
MISPADFIPVADETGLILSINRDLYKKACQQLRLWQTEYAYDPPLMMSLNISPRQFAHPELVKEISTILAEIGTRPDSVHFEIMETIAMSDPGRALLTLEEFKGLGVHLSLDDFGTGYSSLSRLPRFPLDTLKIDRVFISDMMSNRDSHEIVRLIINLAHSLGLTVVAEGTEEEEQVAELRRLGCEMAQGYFFSPPVDDEHAGRLLISNQLTPL